MFRHGDIDPIDGFRVYARTFVKIAHSLHVQRGGAGVLACVQLVQAAVLLLQLIRRTCTRELTLAHAFSVPQQDSCA